MKAIKTSYYLIPVVVCVLVVIGLLYYYFLTDFSKEKEAINYVYIDDDDSMDSVFVKLEPYASIHAMAGFKCIARHWDYKDKVRTGRYAIKPGISVLNTFRNLKNGHQEAEMLTVPESKTMERLAGVLSKKLMMDSTMMERMQKEHDRFWNGERTAKATAIGLTPNEVSTMASIIDEETANNGEKPMIAGMYLNRLKEGMPLQADPTIKFALKRFDLKRIYHDMLYYDSPYNTYRYEGLPPGPIKIASIKGIDAVLNSVSHDFLYMCAKEDFSGTHNFARTYREHLQNAARYAKALNERGIK